MRLSAPRCPLDSRGQCLLYLRMKSFIRSGLFLLCFASLLRAESPPALVTTSSGLQYAIIAPGSGPQPEPGQVVIAHYTGTLPDGTVFDTTRKDGKPFAFTLDRKQVIKGWDEGFALLHVGDKAVFVIPAALAYGDQTRGPIPANSTLRFEVELVELKGRALADLLQETIDTAGLDATKQKFSESKAGGFAGLHVDEGQLNGLGYRYLGKAGKVTRAPGSGNLRSAPAVWTIAGGKPVLVGNP